MRFSLSLATLLVPIIAFLVFASPVASDELDEINKKLEDLTRARQMSVAATRPLEQRAGVLEKQLADILFRVAAIEADLLKKKKDLDTAEEKLIDKEAELASRVRKSYMQSYFDIPILVLFSQTEASELTRDLAYRRAQTDRDKEQITVLALWIKDLEERRAKLESENARLGSIKVKVDEEANFLKKEIAGAKAYQADLSGQIASLTARQQAILSEKSGTFQTTVGDVPLADDPASRPDYNPGFSPAFAAFSFGAPHFKGMSQYGAFGRAKSGQNYEQILKAYYGGGIEVRDHNPDAQITVEGYGTYSLEEYAKRIYEMPGSWGDEGGMEALKAQAVAARSYALARGGTICATESCQVFKPGPKGGKWEEAVNQTRGKVVYANGSPFSTWYASTSGGYQESYSSNGHTTPGFWDTPSGRSGWTPQAYEKVAGSPWFYKGWYRNRAGDSCGRSHPWLTSEEMADILNGWVVLFQGGGDSSRVTPLGSCWGGNPYSMGDLRAIGGYTSVSGVSVTYSEAGTTASVTFQTNKGSVTINGNDFYKAFNLRAPARLALKSGLFNIEKK